VTLLFYKLLAGLLIFLTTLLAIIYPIKSRTLPKHNRPLELADAFASGIFLGTALFHMLPDAIKSFSMVRSIQHYPIAELFCAAGFLTLLFMERLSRYFATAKNQANMFSYMLALILIVHSLIEGTVLGVNTALATTSIIFIAIIAHKGSESFALAVVLNRSNLALTKIIYIILLFSLMTPLGIVSGVWLTSFLKSNENELFIASFNAFAAGTFLYMSTLHHINHHQREHEKEGLLEFGALFAGLVIMGVLAGWA
jgi:zinc transporter ZupT